jgi:hypothetical protein
LYKLPVLSNSAIPNHDHQQYDINESDLHKFSTCQLLTCLCDGILFLELRTGINIPAGILFHVSKQSCVDAEL